MPARRTSTLALAVLATLSLAGCFLSDGRSTRERATPDAATTPPSSHASCDEYLALAGRSGDACSASFTECSFATSIECCQRFVLCEGGVIVEGVACTDDCAQGPHTCAYDGRASCESDPACRWWAPPGVPCIDELPDWGFLPPTCAPRPLSPCSEDVDCGAGEVCGQFAYDPCAGRACNACGGFMGQCIRPY